MRPAWRLPPGLAKPAGRLSFFALVMLAWQAAGTRGDTAYYLSSPAQIAAKLLDWSDESAIWMHVASTLGTTFVGFALASVIAIVLALVLASSRGVAELVEPFLFAAFSTPKVVIAPLLILWVGVGHPPVTALAGLSCFFIVFYGAYGGLRDISKIYLDTAAIFGAGRIRTALQFRAPAAAPFLLASLQQGLIYAFHGSILGEMTASDTGMGYLIIYSATSMDSTSVLAALVVIGLLSFLLVGLLGKVTRVFAAPLSREALA